jgi:glutamate-1-semialdehyde 2,1-aminomutase
MITPFFTSEKVTDYTRAKKADTVRFSKFFNLLIEYGIFPPPSQFEAWFVSIAHTGEDIDTTLRIFEQVLERL